ncbi:MAG: hypothetical protein QOD86_372 [Miltoncostaeaceae bacterium]|jgi:uncharacterized protein YggE|nr:hypothetical protein [Miltoncostaeaceae bacterium]
MTSPEVSEERLEALLAGAAPATPAEEELVAFMTELRGEPVGAPMALRARVGALAPTPTPLERLRGAFTGAGLRKTILVAAPACSLALAAGVVIGLGQRPSPAPPPPETTTLTTTDTGRTSAPPDMQLNSTETRKDHGTSAAPEQTPAPSPPPQTATPSPGFAPDTSGPSGGRATIAPAPVSPRSGGDSVTSQGSGARVVPNAANADDRDAARAEALADALQDAAAKAQRAADRAGVKLGPPEAVAVESSQAPPICPAPATGPTTAPIAPTPPPPASAPAPATDAPAAAGSCTVAADVSVTYPTQTNGATAASPPAP